jgi:4-hydroxy-tetrahydrodipicolinate synthase
MSWGVDGLTAMGVMSETATLTPPEREEALDVIFDTASGRVPVAVGCSAPSPHAAAVLAETAKRLGAVAAMVSAPPLAQDLDALPAFFAAVAARGGLPLVIQDEPAATGVVMPVNVILRCLEAAGARTVKLEDPPTPRKIAALLEVDPSLSVFGGLGGVAALGELRSGACGTMTGFAYPEILAAVRSATDADDAAGAARVFDRYLPLILFEAQPGIGLGIRKEVLRRRGAIATAATRQPPGSIDAATAADLDDVLARVGVRPVPGRFDVEA